MVVGPSQFEIRAAEIDFAGDDIEVFEGGLLDFIHQAALTQQHAVGALAFEFLQPDAAGGIGLWVQVEQQHAAAQGRDASCQVHGGRGLSHAAFLISHGNDFGPHAARGNEKPVLIQVYVHFDWILLSPGGMIVL